MSSSISDYSMGLIKNMAAAAVPVAVYGAMYKDDGEAKRSVAIALAGGLGFALYQGIIRTMAKSPTLSFDYQQFDVMVAVKNAVSVAAIVFLADQLFVRSGIMVSSQHVYKLRIALLSAAAAAGAYILIDEGYFGDAAYIHGTTPGHNAPGRNGGGILPDKH